jgi:hypothetical protein
MAPLGQLPRLSSKGDGRGGRYAQKTASFPPAGLEKWLVDAAFGSLVDSEGRFISSLK